ncbi:MAG: Acetyltransferase (GNAT) family protein [candidate division BRC1 bacterium ADurb.BinA364]|nr:MAG: Acetyltransferase (GNAT) family protein [candidate division BRC1 bacterium ADurb.BinA364]
MIREWGETALKSGERVRMSCVEGPDVRWAPRIERMLGHKGGKWNWQNAEVLRRETGLQARFAILRRGARPFANVMIAEAAGVGLLGHVWTDEADRRQGASSILLSAAMADFRQRGGQALILGTDFDTPPYYLYERFGFKGIEPKSGYMTWHAETPEAFESRFFAEGKADIEPLDWPHWPVSAPLFTGDFGGGVRCAPAGLFGRISSEGPLLSLLRDRAANEGGEPLSAAKNGEAAFALVQRETRAVVAFAASGPHPLWPDAALVDVYAHPAWWSHAPALLRKVFQGAKRPLAAYSDADCPAKAGALAAAGFAREGRLAKWLAIDAAKTRWADIDVWTRRK